MYWETDTFQSMSLGVIHVFRMADVRSDATKLSWSIFFIGFTITYVPTQLFAHWYAYWFATEEVKKKHKMV